MQHARSLKLLLLAGVIAYALGTAFLAYSWSPGPNYRNVTVDTTVNITNALPLVLSVVIENGETNLTLNAGSTRSIVCNATIQDWDGWADIVNVTATLFYNETSNTSSSDSNASHYTNASCELAVSGSGFLRNATCGFSAVQYYANNGLWICNVTVTDPYTGWNLSVVNPQHSLFNRTNIDALLALNVTTLIDYGNLAVGDTSQPQQANVTNLGNRNINVSVFGYGNVSDDGLAMVCDVGNISIREEKFNLIGGGDVTQYTNLSNTRSNITGLTVGRQFDPNLVINTTYWVLYVPPNPFGRCNGTVVFQAELGNHSLY
jgi:hypothetical protein